MRTKLLRLLAILVIASVFLAACGGSGNGTGSNKNGSSATQEPVATGVSSSSSTNTNANQINKTIEGVKNATGKDISVQDALTVLENQRNKNYKDDLQPQAGGEPVDNGQLWLFCEKFNQCGD